MIHSKKSTIMNPQYLFRGKRRDNGEWVEGSLIDKDYILQYIDLAESWEPGTSDHKVTCRAWEITPGTASQWTGLVDSSKKRIFKGDLVSFGNRMYEVAINFNGYYLQRYKLWQGEFKPSFCFGMSLITKPFKKGKRGENGGYVESAEVIGNRWDNPELIQILKQQP